MQKLFVTIFLVMTIVMFAFSLFFMTDFKDLFGLRMKLNEEIAYFHDTVMQGYNQQIFIAALGGMMTLLLFFFLQAFSRVPDGFALTVITVLCLALTAFSFYAIVKTGELSSMYTALDFSHVAMEGGTDYIVRTRTFAVSIVLNVMYIISCISVPVIMFVSHFTFMNSSSKGVGYAEA